jgi:hypothetical protein
VPRTVGWASEGLPYVLAAIDPTAGAAAAEELLAAGFGSNSVRLEDSASVGQIRAAITEQRTPLQRAAANVSRALTDEGLMSATHEVLRRQDHH